MGKIFAIGDIHGCFENLTRLMDKLSIRPEEDTLVFMGDYIDRGPAAFEVVEYLIGLKKIYRNIVFLKGNHEKMLDDYLSGPDKHTYLVNGGQATLESYMKRSQPGLARIPEEHLEFFKSLTHYYETDDYIFVHAGLKDHVPLHIQIPDDFLWIRREFIYSDYDFGKIVVFGHTPFPEPFVEKNKIGIDTGAVYGNVLSCVQLPDLKVFSA